MNPPERREHFLVRWSVVALVTLMGLAFVITGSIEVRVLGGPSATCRGLVLPGQFKPS